MERLTWVVVVDQWEECLFRTAEVLGSNPVIGERLSEHLSTVLNRRKKKRRPGMTQVKN